MNSEASSLALTAELTIPTPLGEMLLARSQQGLAGAWFTDQVACPKPSMARQALNDSLLREAEHQLAGYFSGRTSTFDLPLDTRACHQSSDPCVHGTKGAIEAQSADVVVPT